MNEPKLVCTGCERSKPLKLSPLGCYFCNACMQAMVAAGLFEDPQVTQDERKLKEYEQIYGRRGEQHGK